MSNSSSSTSTGFLVEVANVALFLMFVHWAESAVVKLEITYVIYFDESWFDRNCFLAGPFNPLFIRDLDLRFPNLKFYESSFGFTVIKSSLSFI